MLEMREVTRERVQIWNDGVPAGGATWTHEALTKGRERVIAVRLKSFQAAEEDAEALRAYLDFLWTSRTVAVVYELDGRMTWYSKALEKRFSLEEKPK